MNKQKIIKISLAIILLLISIQVLLAIYINFPSSIRYINFSYILFISPNLLIGSLSLIFAILILLNKKKTRIFIYPLLIIFIIYCTYYLINSFILINESIYKNTLLLQIAQMSGYIILSLLGLIINWKSKKY